MYTRFCSTLLFPLHERLKGHHSVRLRGQLEETQWWSRERLAALQVERLRRFLQAVGRDVPYYSRLFARTGFKPEAVLSVADLQKLPFLTKELIRAHSRDLKSIHASNLVRYSTGGSSGEPLTFFLGKERISHDVAAKWRATRWWGVDIGDPEVVLWGSPIEIGTQDRLKSIRDRVFRTRLLPAFQLSPASMDGYIDKLQRIRPRMLFGYASALAMLARHATTRGRDLGGLGVRVAFSTGETLYPDQRDDIAAAFHAPVANGYGSRDAGFIAHECREGGLHLSAEHVIVELVTDSGDPVEPGQMGEIVVTHMATGDFPFVRYRTGDIAALALNPCPCGRILPMLERVFGRSTDFIRTPSGGVMHALAMIYEVRDKPGVKAFKFVQEKDYSLELLLVTGPEFDPEAEADIRKNVLARTGPEVQFSIRRVPEIPPEKSGKYRYVVSRAVPPNLQNR